MRQLKWIPTQIIRLDRGPLGPSVMDLAIHLIKGGTVPPIHVQIIDGEYWIRDGRHRVQAHRLIGREYILARFSKEVCHETKRSNIIG